MTKMENLYDQGNVYDLCPISLGCLHQAGVPTRARGYKTFFMLNSGEHEILNAHK